MWLDRLEERGLSAKFYTGGLRNCQEMEPLRDFLSEQHEELRHEGETEWFDHTYLVYIVSHESHDCSVDKVGIFPLGEVSGIRRNEK